MNVILLKSLPVRDPQELVILTNPNASGVSDGLDSGERSLMTYAEFTQLRDHATSFSGMGVSQAQLNRWQVRIAGGGQQDARAKLVSQEPFSLLAVEPSIGLVFHKQDA